MDADTEIRIDELDATNRRLKKWLSCVTAWLVITWFWPIAPTVPTVDAEQAGINAEAAAKAWELAELPADMRDKVLANWARLRTANAETKLSTPDISEIYYTKDPLPKDYLLKDQKWHPAAFAQCHRLFMELMQWFPNWALLDVHGAFETYTVRGPTVAIGLAFKTKMPDEKWIIHDQTWFFLDGQFVESLESSELGKTGALGWCLLQEAIQHVYGPISNTYDTAKRPRPAMNPGKKRFERARVGVGSEN